MLIQHRCNLIGVQQSHQYNRIVLCCTSCCTSCVGVADSLRCRVTVPHFNILFSLSAGRLLNTVARPHLGPHKLSTVRSVARFVAHKHNMMTVLDFFDFFFVFFHFLWYEYTGFLWFLTLLCVRCRRACSPHRTHRQVPEQMLGRHIATNPHDPHCVKSRQCYGDGQGSTIVEVCNPDIHPEPISMTFASGNDVCGAFWTDELLIATCGTRPYAERYAAKQRQFFKDYK